MDYWLPIIVLFGAFFFMLALGVPIVYAIGLSTLASISTQLDFNSALSVVSQKLASGLDSFTLLAIPFFILSGNIMNHGGIARRLINFARILGGRLPGSLAHCNILANMLFGAISGSAVASAAAMGGVMHPQQVKEGYDPAFSTAVNVASAPTGLLIPPSNTLIVYSLVSGGTSIAALFLAGYVPGILLGLALMVIAGIIAVRRGYPKPERPTLRQAGVAIWMAIPSIFLIVLIMGGVLSGIFTPYYQYYPVDYRHFYGYDTGGTDFYADIFTGCHRTGHGPDSLWYCHGAEHVYRYLYSACRQCVICRL